MITVSWDVILCRLREKVPSILKQMLISTNPAVPGIFNMNGYGPTVYISVILTCCDVIGNSIWPYSSINIFWKLYF
jgi:hypothetical protein